MHEEERTEVTEFATTEANVVGVMGARREMEKAGKNRMTFEDHDAKLNSYPQKKRKSMKAFQIQLERHHTLDFFFQTRSHVVLAASNSDTLELPLQRCVSCYVVLGMEPGSSGMTAIALN